MEQERNLLTTAEAAKYLGLKQKGDPPMRKGRFGIVLCLYPILAFACVIIGQPILCALIFGVALFAEREDRKSVV